MTSLSYALDLHELANELDDLLREDHLASYGKVTFASDDDRLTALLELRDALGGDLRINLDVIPDYEFVEYAKNYMIDLGYITEKNPLFNHVRWEAFADELVNDFQTLSFEGCLYYFRQ